MEKIVYPEFPLITNIEFFCLYLLENGPTHRNDLIAAFRQWRNNATQFSYYELFGTNQQRFYNDDSAGLRLNRYRRNFDIHVLPRLKGRIISLTGKGFHTAALTLNHIKTLSKLTVDERTFYVYYRHPGRYDYLAASDFSLVHHIVWHQKPSYKVVEVKAKTLLEAQRIARGMQNPFGFDYSLHRVCKNKYSLTSAKIICVSDKCRCVKCVKCEE